MRGQRDLRRIVKQDKASRYHYQSEASFAFLESSTRKEIMSMTELVSLVKCAMLEARIEMVVSHLVSAHSGGEEM